MSNSIATEPSETSSAGPPPWVWNWCHLLPSQQQFLSSRQWRRSKPQYGKGRLLQSLRSFAMRRPGIGDDFATAVQPGTSALGHLGRLWYNAHPGPPHCPCYVTQVGSSDRCNMPVVCLQSQTGSEVGRWMGKLRMGRPLQLGDPARYTSSIAVAFILHPATPCPKALVRGMA